MDLVDLITEKRFLGQEFLTWLWWRSDAGGGVVEIPSIGPITVVFEKHMLLEYGEADYNEKLVCSGLQTELKEARTGLRTGKKLEQARIQLVRDEYEWNVTLAATHFEYRNIRCPKTAASQLSAEMKDEEAEGAILERIFLFDEIVRIVHELFRAFLQVRTGPRWGAELAALRSWVHRSSEGL